MIGSRRRTERFEPVDGRVHIGSVTLRSPVLTASGTAGYGTELAPYVDLSTIGAVVTKSIAHFQWDGNPAPRVHTVPAGMVNAVGLQGPGVRHWLDDELPALIDTGADIVCSIWGRSVDDYAKVAAMLANAPKQVVAVEVNLSCPNLEGRGSMFAHDARLSAEVIAASADCGRPLWAKLSPNTDRIIEVASAVANAGAEAVTMVNTLLGMVYDRTTFRPVLGNGGGGVSGPAIHPIAVRAVADVRSALHDLPIIGVGGIVDGWSAAEFFIAGANAIQVGTATFAEPAAVGRIQGELFDLVASRGCSSMVEFSEHISRAIG